MDQRYNPSRIPPTLAGVTSASARSATIVVAGLAFGVALACPATAQRGPDRTQPELTLPEQFEPRSGANRDKSRPESKQVEPKQGDSKPGDSKQADRKPGPDKKAEAKEPKPIPRSLRAPGGSMAPEGGSQRASLLAELYAYLATATDEDVAKQTAKAIEHVWQSASTDTVNLMVERAARALKEKNSKLALDLMEKAAQLAPDNPEVFARRALVYYNEGNLERALGDLRRALALDPNHYRSLESLGQILKELDNKKAALAVYRQLYQVHPFFPGGKAQIDELAREVEGHPS